MITTYATNIHDANLKGGTTQPSILKVYDKTNNYIGDYVVKIFSTEHEEKTNATVKEIIAYLLSQEFDLLMPEAALVEVPQILIDELQNKRQHKTSLKEGTYFGTLYIENVKVFHKEFTPKNLDIDTISKVFAFDMLILNVDRRIEKPNCLVTPDNKDLYLIDHELSFELTSNYEELLKTNKWAGLATGFNNPKREHIFYDFLKSKNTQQAINFDEFQLYLYQLNIDAIKSFIEQLHDLQVVTVDLDRLYDCMNYLKAVKKDSERFCKNLHLILS